VIGSSTVRLIGAAFIIVAAGAAGFYVYRGSTLAPAITPTKADSPAQPVEPDLKEKPKVIPDTLPDITLADRSGKPTKLSSFGGRSLMVNFWATWCAPCRREIPLLNKIRAERQAQDAEIVGIAVDFREDVLKFLTVVPINYPLLIGEEDGLAAAEAFGMSLAFPFSVFIDSQNRILTLKVGELHEDEANFAFDRLRDIDNGVLTREAAQSAVSAAFRDMAARRARDEATHTHPAN
jgi:thiol-disulfide isomerase/thioredoxin